MIGESAAAEGRSGRQTPGALTSLHAKGLVVDRRFALVSSANFTERGLTRNLGARC